MSGLISIVIPSSIEVLCKSCFSECKSLSSIIFESGSHLQGIEAYAFSMSDLISIILQHSVEFIDGSAFAGLHLDFIGISTGESRFRICDSFLEDIPNRSIVQCFRDCKSIIIPSSIEILCKLCFCKCESLSSIIFESGSHLQRIEEYAFSINGLISIVIPSSIEVLCKSCFYRCISFSSIIFESGSHLQRIEEYAFSMSDLISIVIPSSIEVLYKSCFSECTSLSSVSFESGSHLQHIEEYAFSMSDLISIVIPSSIAVCESDVSSPGLTSRSCNGINVSMHNSCNCHIYA
jgi:hypothetical protein